MWFDDFQRAYVLITAEKTDDTLPHLSADCIARLSISLLITIAFPGVWSEQIPTSDSDLMFSTVHPKISTMVPGCRDRKAVSYIIERTKYIQTRMVYQQKMWQARS